MNIDGTSISDVHLGDTLIEGSLTVEGDLRANGADVKSEYLDSEDTNYIHKRAVRTTYKSDYKKHLLFSSCPVRLTLVLALPLRLP